MNILVYSFVIIIFCLGILLIRIRLINSLIEKVAKITHDYTLYWSINDFDYFKTDCVDFDNLISKILPHPKILIILSFRLTPRECVNEELLMHFIKLEQVEFK